MRGLALTAAFLALATALLAGCSQGVGVPTYMTLYPPREIGGGTLPISLVDQTGLVTGIFAAPDVAASSDPGSVEALPGPGNRLRVTWLGELCDDRVTMVLNSLGEGFQVVIHNHPQFAAGALCEAGGTPLTVDIAFAQPIDPTRLSVSIQFP